MITKSTLVSTKYEVVVAGGGPAGLGAALASAQNGVRTLLLERYGFLGGVAALGLGMQINHILVEGEPRDGLPGTLAEKLLSYGPDVIRSGNYNYRSPEATPTGYISCPPEYLNDALFDLLEEHGVDYLLHAVVQDVVADGNVVNGVAVAGKGLPLTIPSDVVIDATGDGDVAHAAGAAYSRGREDDGFLSPMTLLFTAGGIDHDRMYSYLEEDGGFRQVLKHGHHEGYTVPDVLSPSLRADGEVVYFNGSGTRGRGNFDGTNIFDLTCAERLGRKQAVEAIQLFKDREIPGFEGAYLIQAAPQIGVRETRRIQGEYTLTEEDIRRGTTFPDVVALRHGELDIGFVTLEPMASPHGVPYRCLLPRHIENLLVAGRCISTSHVAHSAGKSMGNCIATGQAAGTAAALAVREKVSARDLDVDEIQEVLIAQGVRLDTG